jgi:hypothetical protein
MTSIIASISAWWTYFIESRATAITLTLKGSLVAVDGATSWLYCIPDGETEPALSAESGGNVRMARCNPTTYTGGVLSWTDVTGSGDIADHVHIYAHGYHWICYSKTAANELHLMQIDSSFIVLNDWNIIPDLVASGYTATNDMAMTDTPLGVLIEVFGSGNTALLMRIKTDGTLVSSSNAADPSGTTITNGGYLEKLRSDSWTGSGRKYAFIAPETMDPTVTSNLRYFVIDKTGTTIESTATTITTSTHGAMTAQIVFANDYRLITYAERIASSSGGDSATIVRQLYTDVAGTTSGAKETLLATETGARPHTARWGNYLITCWDQTDFHCYIRVDTITSS